jgi:hypothetical protein
MVPQISKSLLTLAEVKCGARVTSTSWMLFSIVKFMCPWALAVKKPVGKCISLMRLESPPANLRLRGKSEKSKNPTTVVRPPMDDASTVWATSLTKDLRSFTVFTC